MRLLLSTLLSFIGIAVRFAAAVECGSQVLLPAPMALLKSTLA
jgi:hypothetical protein